MKALRRRVLASSAGAFLVGLAFRALLATWRVRVSGPEPDWNGGRRLVICFWHAHLAGLLAHPRPAPLAVLISPSRDGTLPARIVAGMGVRVVRGSSSCGGVEGLRALLAEMAAGAHAAMAVDGPRGPRGEVKPGAITAARRGGGLIVPVALRAEPAWVFRRSWDHFCLPKPFARVLIARGEAFAVDDGDPAAQAARLKAALDGLSGGP